MGWLASEQRFRESITLDNSAVGGAAADAALSIPADWDIFWDNVLDGASAGFDVHFTTADGFTPVTFERSSFVIATRVATFEFDNLKVEPNGMTALYMYWGDPAGADLSVVVTPISAITAIVDQSEPTGIRVNLLRENPGEVNPFQRVTKSTTEIVDVFWLVDDRLRPASAATEGQSRFEELEDIVSFAVELAGVDQSLGDAGDARVITASNGKTWVRTRILAGGVDGTPYTAVLKVQTSEGQQLEGRVLLLIEDVDES